MRGCVAVSGLGGNHFPNTIQCHSFVFYLGFCHDHCFRGRDSACRLGFG